MPELMTADLVVLDADLGSGKEDVIGALARVVTGAGRATDGAQLERDLLAREAQAATGMKGGIAIPHCRSAAVTEPTLAFARLADGVDFGAKDGAAELVFLIAAPEGGGDTHLQVLTQLARALVKPEFTDALRRADSAEDVVAIVGEQVGSRDGRSATSSTAGVDGGSATSSTAGVDGGSATSSTTGTEAPTAPAAEQAPAVEPVETRLVAVTSCPTGIAHTYMAAEALEAAAARAGVEIAVETQGSAGGSSLPASVIAAADAVIFAADVGVRDRGRFAGKPVVSSGVKGPIDDGDAMIASALAYAAADDPPRVESSGGGATTDGAGSGAGETWGGRVRRVLMTGVSYMIPFVAAGGLLIALGFLLGGYEITGPADDIIANNTLFNLPDLGEAGLEHALLDSALLAYLGALLFKLGALAFGFLVPALAGYIAYAIADRPGIAPGFVMGAVAGAINTGFLGGIVGGVLAGLAAHWIAGWRVPSALRGLMPVLVIPLGATLISGLLMLLVLAKPLGTLMDALNDGLNGMSGGSAVVLGIVLGLMMAFDMGGPLNKVAYGFATAGLSAAGAATDAPQLKIMAAVMLAGMVPPIALALATVVRPRLFNRAERENGKAAWLMGASFITEGAIPFAAADPLRVIPSIMLGSAVTGGLAQALDVSLRAPHGGVFVLFAVDNIVGFLIALVAGVLAAAAAVVALKSLGSKDVETGDLEHVAA